MASEDVLEMAEHTARVLDRMGETLVARHHAERVRELIAEVRELRRDKARLDRIFASKYACISVKGPYDWNPVDNREELDAAMGGEG